MNDLQKGKYDLEDRTLKFARAIRNFINKIPKTLLTIDDCKQLIRSSGSVGANYIEANESLSHKDFIVRAKISKKEAKESIYWLNLLDLKNKEMNEEKNALIKECQELIFILAAIIRKKEQSA